MKTTGVELLRTLTFKTKKLAEKNQKDIKAYFGERLSNSKILFGKDERGGEGHYVEYHLKKIAN